MKPKQKIIEYMKAKRLAIFKITKLNLYNRLDYNEIRKLNDNECERIWEYLSYKPTRSIDLCPQCILVNYSLINNSCNRCNYGKRHGICEVGDDVWIKIARFEFNLPTICHPIIDKLNKEK